MTTGESDFGVAIESFFAQTIFLPKKAFLLEEIFLSKE